MKKIVNKIAMKACLLFTLFITACSSFLDEKPPAKQLSSSLVFQHDATAEEAIVGLYTSIPFAMTSDLTFYASLYSDELVKSSASETEMQFQNSQLTDNNELLASIWSSSYAYIYKINACLEGLNAAANLTPSLKQQLLGEALFFRAFSYFYLANYFGDIPLVVDTDYQKNAFLARTDINQIYTQIIEDLKAASTYLTNSKTNGNLYRVNSLATQAFLARVYLYRENWKEALTISQNVIEKLGAPPLPKASSVFYSSGTEAILKMMPHSNNGYTHIGGQETHIFVPSNSTSIPNYVFRESFMMSFEKDDERKLNWINSNTVNNITYHYPYKYKNRQGIGQVESYQVFRIAEQYLIRAEANAHLENFAEALTDVNRIRDRAKLPLLSSSYNSVSKEELLELIAIENKHEFFAERGHRWLNIKRTAKENEVLGGIKGSWDTFRSIWPVPYNEIELNKNLLPQNYGY